LPKLLCIVFCLEKTDIPGSGKPTAIERCLKQQSNVQKCIVVLTAKVGQQLVFLTGFLLFYVKQAADQKGSQPGSRSEFPQDGNSLGLKTSLKVVSSVVKPTDGSSATPTPLLGKFGWSREVLSLDGTEV